MAEHHDPKQEKHQSWRSENPPPTDPSRGKERPMDDPGRGHGDKLEKKLPVRESEKPGPS